MIDQSKISGEKVITYFPDQPEIWKVPLYEELTPSLTVRAPQYGYYIPREEAQNVSDKLKLHQIQFSKVLKNKTFKAQVFRAFSKDFAKTPFEGRQTLMVKGEWKEETCEIRTGSLFVPIKQKNSRLVLQLFEPEAKDSFLSWGYFNRYFEQKEYMENYVVEEVAQNLMSKDPSLKEEFERRLKTDKSFAVDPKSRRDFFYQRHLSWDTRLDAYPILKL